MKVLGLEEEPELFAGLLGVVLVFLVGDGVFSYSSEEGERFKDSAMFGSWLPRDVNYMRTLSEVCDATYYRYSVRTEVFCSDQMR